MIEEAMQKYGETPALQPPPIYQKIKDTSKAVVSGAAAVNLEVPEQKERG